MLVRGGAPGTVVDDNDITELLQRLPDARVELVEGAGHSIQGDRPLELVRLLNDFIE
jgi:pimeloyl-ACP methyl ester carboxylesterase